MICPNCGKYITENSKFCGECGVNLRKAAKVFSGFDYSAQSANAVDDVPKSAVAAPKKSAGVSRRQSGTVLDRRPNLLIIGLIAATFFASLIITIVIFFGSSNEGTSLIYISDGVYGVIRDLESGAGVDLINDKSSETSQDMLKFAPDRKTVYFMTRFDGESGALNRTDYTRVKVTSSRNEEHVETVAARVVSFMPCGQSEVLYLDPEGVLWFYDGENSIQIARSVVSYCADGQGRVVFAAGEEPLSLYGSSLADPDNRIKLVSRLSKKDCEAILSKGVREADFDAIPYVDDSILYITGFGRAPEVIAENVSLSGPASEKVCSPSSDFNFFVKKDEEFVRYSLLSGDPNAARDAAAKEPSKADFTDPIYKWNEIANINAAEEEFEMLAASCTLPLAGLEGMTMEEASVRSGLSIDRKQEVAYEFVEKYAELANEEGLIDINEDIKADLKKLADVSGMRNWLLFCLAREQTGSRTDTRAFAEAAAAYEKTKQRNELRNELKKPLPLYDLYYYHNGKTKLVQEDVVLCDNTSSDGVSVLYTKDAVALWLSGKSFDDISSAVPDAGEADCVIAAAEGGRVVNVPVQSLQGADIGEGSYYISKDEILLHTGSGALYAAQIKGNTAQAFRLEQAEAAVCGSDEDGLYYTSNGYVVGENSWADLYLYKGGKSVCLAKELQGGTDCLIYDDGTLLGCTAITASKGKTTYELTLFTQDGSGKFISDAVTDFQRVNESMFVYVSEGDLYLYNGKTGTRLKNGIEEFWISGGFKNDKRIPVQWDDGSDENR